MPARQPHARCAAKADTHARERRARDVSAGGAHTRSVRARGRLPRVPRQRRHQAEGRGDARVRRRHIAADRDRRHGTRRPARLRTESACGGMTAPLIYVRSPQPDYHVASIPALLGCVGTGKTRDEAIANARIAFRAYLEVLAARGISTDYWKDLDPQGFAVAEFPAGGLPPRDEHPVAAHEAPGLLHLFEPHQPARIAPLAGPPAHENQRAPARKTCTGRPAPEHGLNTQGT